MQESRRRTFEGTSQEPARPSTLLTDGECATSAVRAVARGARYRHPPLEVRWTEATGVRPVPVRAIAPHSRRRQADLHPILEPALAQIPLLNATPLDFSDRIHALCADVAARCPFYATIDTNRILFGVTRARGARRHGLQAKVTPMRFQDGALTQRRRGHVYQVQRYFVGEVEMLYLMTFCLPRFLEQSFDDKLITIFHELQHISPAFNGDLRRHPGRYCLHTHSQKHYDGELVGLVREYLATNPDPALYGFLRLTFDQLHAHCGSIIGYAVPVPKLIPVVQG